MTQCPLVEPAAPHASTLSDALLMVLQQNISLWVQIMSSTDSTPHAALGRQCYLFPLLDFERQALDHGLVVSDVLVAAGQDGQVLPYGLPYAEHAPGASTLNYNVSNITFTVKQRANSGAVVAERRVQYLWYNNWPDFGVPAAADDEVCGCVLDCSRGLHACRSAVILSVFCASGFRLFGSYRPLRWDACVLGTGWL
jgi:hypothetical protein